MSGYVRADQRREQLLEAAVQVLVDGGLADLTLRAVAQRAGVRLSTLQYIFPSRSELVVALVDQVLADSGYRQFEAGPQGLAVELVRLVDWFAENLSQRPAIIELARYELLDRLACEPAGEPLALPAVRPMTVLSSQEWLSDIAALAHEEYDLPPADLGRLWAWAHLGLMVQTIADPDPQRYRSEALWLVDRVVDLAAPRPRPDGWDTDHTGPAQPSGTRQLRTDPPVARGRSAQDPP